LIVRSGQERIALPARDVREVVPLGRLTRVPHAPPALLGLGNVRGAVMPMVSLDALLDRPSSAGRRVIVLDRADPVGLVVAEVPHLAEEDAGARSIDIGALLDRGFGAKDRAAAPSVGIARASGSRHRAVAAREPDAISLLSFTVADRSFALPLDQIDEAIALPGDVALLPGTDRVALGSIAHRGGLLPLLSLHALLKLDETGASPKPRVIVARIKGHRVGLVVDALDAILQVSEAAIDPLPIVLSRGGAEARIQAIVRHDDGHTLVSVLATDHLLNEVIMRRLQDETRPAVRAATDAPEALEPLLVFRLGDEEFGVPVASVREVVAMPDRLTRLPRAPVFVAGLMNLRGRAVPVIDQRLRFGVPGGSQARRRVIVVALGQVEAGFVVDGVAEVLRVPASQLTAAPDMGERTRVFDRVASVDGGRRTVLVIEPQELLDRAERDLLAAMRDREAAAES
jgi:purine-binding chemotaxis protein CheW